MNTLYLWLNIGALIFPLLLSFNRIGHFYKRLKPALIAISIVGLVFISWDIWFTKEGIWWFNEEYLVGLSIANLPIEEWLFFWCIPYAFMFLYDQFVILNVGTKLNKSAYKIDLLFLFISIAYLVVGWGNVYTTVVALQSLIMVAIFMYFKPRNRGIFYLSYAIILIPFSIINGVLTGYITDEPIVSYNSSEIIGLRLGTIPIEDFVYFFLMYGLTYMIYEKLKPHFISKT